MLVLPNGMSATAATAAAMIATRTPRLRRWTPPLTGFEMVAI
jgi:hypothetical protein